MAGDKHKRSLEGISLVEKADTKRISARSRNWTTRSHAQPFKCSIELEKKSLERCHSYQQNQGDWIGSFTQRGG